VNVTAFFFLTVPVAVGLKATSTVHCCPAGIELPQLPPTTTKGDAATMLVIETAAVVEWLVAVTVFDVLVTPTFSSPKLSVPGENDSLGGLGALTLAGSADCAKARCANATRINSSEIVNGAIDCINRLLERIDYYPGISLFESLAQDFECAQSALRAFRKPRGASKSTRGLSPIWSISYCSRLNLKSNSSLKDKINSRSQILA